MKQLTVTADQAPKRLDVFAAEHFPSLSRAFVQRLCGDGKILVNGAQEKHGYRLRAGDKVAIDFKLSEIEEIADIDLPIIYQDDNILVVNKPDGVISHARGKYWNEPSVASFVRQVTGQPGERAGIVHRLDRATSGVMICAKNQQTLSWLQKQFSQRNVKKSYIAVISGHIQPEEAIIEMPIERNPKAPATFRVGSNGKAARTTYKVIGASEKYEMLELLPLTGRTHQLRVHLAHQHHPIVGDTLYGGEQADRLLLHAKSLEITLPGGERKVFTAPLPTIFRAYVPE